MIRDISLLSKQEYDFNDTSFGLLLQNRIYKVLLVCSNYDSFMLEEDGRIDEQIFNEYTSLNLRYPPIFNQVDTEERAFEVLENEDIDLVILAKGTHQTDTFQLAKKIKHKYFSIPIVVLTYFTREVSLRLENEDLSAIDYVFSWLGNADLLLAIIKLIEDKMNAKFDVEEVGVQTILLVEDSPKYYSRYLPMLYKIIMEQTQRLIEDVNTDDLYKVLKMRARPKILLAHTYEEAMEIFDKYKDYFLCVISDVCFPKNNELYDLAGFEFVKFVKENVLNLPTVLQSSNPENARKSYEIKSNFINKNSESLLQDLKSFIN